MPSGAVAYAQVFTPGRIGTLELRNRVIKAATYEGMCPGGVPSDALIRHHRDLAAGGVGMTTVAYCAVSPNGRTFEEQMVGTASAACSTTWGPPGEIAYATRGAHE